MELQPWSQASLLVSIIFCTVLLCGISAENAIETYYLSKLGSERKDRVFSIPCGSAPLSEDDTFAWTHDGEPVDLLKDTRVSIAGQAADGSGEGSAESAESAEENPESDSKQRGHLTVTHADELDAGYWKCTVEHKGGAEDQYIYLLKSPPKVTRAVKSVTVTEGDIAKLSCKVYGNPLPTVYWTKMAESDYDEESEHLEQAKKVKIVSGDHLTLSKNDQNIEGAVLHINDTEKDDRAYYFCHAENALGFSQDVAMLRVKDKLAALWPFLGIVAEVIILMVIIFIFERRQAAKQREIEEENPHNEAKVQLTADDNELRQRTGATA